MMSATDKLKEVIERFEREPKPANDSRSETQILGILLSRFTEFDGLDILQIASYALEDANFSDIKLKVDDLALAIENEGKTPVFDAPCRCALVEAEHTESTHGASDDWFAEHYWVKNPVE